MPFNASIGAGLMKRATGVSQGVPGQAPPQQQTVPKQPAPGAGINQQNAVQPQSTAGYAPRALPGPQMPQALPGPQTGSTALPGPQTALPGPQRQQFGRGMGGAMVPLASQGMMR